MNFRSAAVAVACLGTLVLGAGPSAANELSSGTAAPMAAPVYETGYVTTQGRGRGGNFRRGGGGGSVGFAPRRRNNTGRNVAIGVGALVLGGIVASEVARSQGGYSPRGNNCNRWNYQCNNGSGWACRNLDRYC